MDYSLTLCFAGFNSKMRKIQKERREKEQLQQSMSRQTSKRMAKEKCHDSISSVTTQRIEYRRRAMSQQKTVCRDRT